MLAEIKIFLVEERENRRTESEGLGGSVDETRGTNMRRE